jgi:hypothetical protein
MTVTKACILLFLVGSWTLPICPVTVARDAQAKPELGKQFPPKSRVEDFVNTGAGEMLADDGTVLAFATYRAADGVIVTVMHKEFPSASRAHEQIAKEASKATKVLDWNPIRNNKGSVSGERVVAVMPTSESSHTVHSILWTDGPQFYQIFSSSLQDDMKIEKQMNGSVH